MLQGNELVQALEVALDNALDNIRDNAADPRFPLAPATQDVAALVHLLRPQWPADMAMGEAQGPPNILALL